MSNERLVLTLNVGSTTIKMALYQFAEQGHPVRRASGLADRLGRTQSTWRFQWDGREQTALLSESTVDAAMASLGSWLHEHFAHAAIVAVGHRFVHGGRLFSQATPITDDVEAALAGLSSLAPNHLPAELAGLRAARLLFAQALHVACFDTAFHRTIPDIQRRYALPREFLDLGIERYGFHGLSYQYLSEELVRIAGTTAAQGKVVYAHLGSGVSLCATVGGQSVATTMGFTPLSGLIMGTRCGDLDPEIPLFLAEQQQLRPAELRDIFSKRSGLLALSGTTADVRELLACEAHDPAAREALARFCLSISQGIAAMAVAIGGLETLVFSAGIGAASPPIRARIVGQLAFLGVQLDPNTNDKNSVVISAPSSAVHVHVIPTDEEQMIARQSLAVLRGRH